MYTTDDEHDAAVRAAFKYRPTPKQLVRDEAAADQIEAAVMEAERYDAMFFPSRHQQYGLKRSPSVRRAIEQVMGFHHSFGSTYCDFREPEIRRDLGSWPSFPGLHIPLFNEGDPDNLRSLFVIFADEPNIVHALRFESLPDLISRQLQTRHDCDWPMELNGGCMVYAKDYVCFSRGSLVVAFSTCHVCKQWLMDGAPSTGSWFKKPVSGHMAKTQWGLAPSKP